MFYISRRLEISGLENMWQFWQRKVTGAAWNILLAYFNMDPFLVAVAFHHHLRLHLHLRLVVEMPLSNSRDYWDHLQIYNILKIVILFH